MVSLALNKVSQHRQDRVRTNFVKELLRQVVPCTVTNIIIIVMKTIIVVVTITTINIFVIIVTIIIVTIRRYDFQPNLQVQHAITSRRK